MPGWLVDDDDVFVLVEDRQRQRLRLRHRIDRLRHVDADRLSGLHGLVRLRLAAGDMDALLDQPLNLRSRAVGQDRGQKTVEPDPFVSSDVTIGWSMWRVRRSISRHR